MRCPFCQWEDSKVVDSRDVDDAIRRRRECLNPKCSARFTTHERVQSVALFVVKKDGRREQFSREKLLVGLHKACEKRPLATGAIEALAADIEVVVQQANVPEVPSASLGELVMERLHRLDPIAYVRFASVYRQFADLAAFREELESLTSGTRPGDAQLPLLDPEFTAPSLRLRSAAATTTRTRRTERPVQDPVSLNAQAQPTVEQPKRRRQAQ